MPISSVVVIFKTTLPAYHSNINNNSIVSGNFLLFFSCSKIFFFVCFHAKTFDWLLISFARGCFPYYLSVGGRGEKKQNFILNLLQAVSFFFFFFFFYIQIVIISGRKSLARASVSNLQGGVFRPPNSGARGQGVFLGK